MSSSSTLAPQGLPPQQAGPSSQGEGPAIGTTGTVEQGSYSASAHAAGVQDGSTSNNSGLRTGGTRDGAGNSSSSSYGPMRPDTPSQSNIRPQDMIGIRTISPPSGASTNNNNGDGSSQVPSRSSVPSQPRPNVTANTDGSSPTVTPVVGATPQCKKQPTARWELCRERGWW